MSVGRSVHGAWAAGIVIGLCLAMAVASADIGLADTTERGSEFVTEIDGPDSVVAGETAEFGIRAGGDVVSLLVIGAIGTTEVGVAMSNGEGVLALDEVATEHAGVLTIQAGLGSASVRHDVRIEPGPVTAPVAAVVGQRTLVVGVDSVMIVATPTDANGNAVAPGQNLNAEVHYPGGSQRSLAFSTHALVGFAWLQSSTTAGLGSISLTAPITGSGAAASHPLEFQQVASVPTRFDLTATPARLGHLDTAAEGAAWSQLADGQTLWRVRSTSLQDEYGNTIPDGSSARLVLSAPDGWRQAIGVVVGGHLEVYVPAPTLPGVMTVTAQIAGVTSTPHDMTFRRAVPNVPAHFADQPDDHELDQNQVEVIIGPVLLGSGGYVPDGTVASLEPLDGSSVIATTVLRNGAGTITVSTPELAAADAQVQSLRVSVLGTSEPVGDKQ